MVVSCVISEIKRDIGRKSPFFHTALHSMLPSWDLGQNVATMFGEAKLEWCGYATVKKV